MKQDQKQRAILAAGILGAALTLAIALVFVLAQPGDPYLALEGGQIKQAADGSYQLLVDVVVGNVPQGGDPTKGATGMLSGIVAYLQYNENMVVPSSAADNSPVVPDLTDLWDETGYSCFQLNPSLEYMKDGERKGIFEPESLGGISVIQVLENTSQIMVILNAGSYSEGDAIETETLGTLTYNYTDSIERHPYIDATGKDRITIGQLSFRVKTGDISQLLDFDGLSAPDGMKEGAFLVRIRNQEDGDYSNPSFQTLSYSEPTSDVKKYETPGESECERSVSWKFDMDSLVSAESAEKEVTINAYQAFGEGTPLDLADALIRYSPTVRGTHLEDLMMEDFSLFWGADDCVITKVEGTAETEVGTLKLTMTDDKYDGGYTVTDASGDPVSDDWYDPTGGEYYLTQKFVYTTAQGADNEFDIKVHLTVTPVTVTGVTAENLLKTYKNDGDLPLVLSKLDLPNEAQLTTDVTPGLVSLTLPIDGWQSPAGTNVASDLSNLYGQNSEGTTVFWTTPDNGDYTLTALADYDASVLPATSVVEYSKDVIQAVYPWLTVNGSYTLTALRRIVDAEGTLPSYTLEYTSTGSDGLLTLHMTKWVEGKEEQMQADTFRLKLPGGTIVDTQTSISSGEGFDWVQNEGDTGYCLTLKGSAANELWQLVQSSINLGGWFEAEVTEGGEASGFVGAYVPARENVYTAATEFSFLNDKAALYPFYRNQETLPTYVTLPLGDDYIVPTTYDGMTGAEPGELHSFKVDAWSVCKGLNGEGWDETVMQWTAGTASQIQVQYGPQLYADEYAYTGFGTVSNPASHAVTMKVEARAEEQPEKNESITLTYEGSGDSVRPEDIDKRQLLRVIFDTKQEGYKYRQNVTLTLTNVGDEPIKGLYIDNTGTAGCTGEFIITRQPSPDLAPGASTTFDVSYVWDLTAQGGESYPHMALDPAPLKIYSADHGPDGDPLKSFEATFKVTQNPVWRLYLKTVPADGSYGTAQPVQGAANGTLDRTPASYTYSEGETAWILATPVDGYMVKEVYYYDEDNNKQTLSGYTPSVLPEGSMEMVTNVDMPGHDLTVYVVFNEPLYSKLMLLDLQGWSAPSDDYLKIEGHDYGENQLPEGHQLPLRLHRSDEAATSAYSIVRDIDDYTFNSALEIPTTNPVYTGWDELQQPDQAAELGEDTYLVVIPADAAHSQVRLQLRDLAKDVEPSIVIQLDYGLSLDAYTYTTPAGTEAELRHISAIFNSPPRGERMTATITLSAENETEGQVTRTYKLIFARASEAEPAYPMTAGNSPFGMIEWDDALTDKTAAKAAFAAGNCFTAGNTPAAAAGLSMIYWPEAWGSGTNYDQIDDALFVFAGEKFEDFGPLEGEVTNTVGDVVHNKDIERRLTVALLEVTAPTQMAQFAGTETQTLDLGAADVAEISADVWNDAGGTAYKVRPGVYELEYVYIDYDGSSEVVFSRPLIVLARVGDVNLDGEVTDADAAAFERRVSSPLGYEADYAYSQTFALRGCDVNNDRNINNIDANTIRGDTIQQFYLPVGYGGK